MAGDSRSVIMLRGTAVVTHGSGSHKDSLKCESVTPSPWTAPSEGMQDSSTDRTGAWLMMVPIPAQVRMEVDHVFFLGMIACAPETRP